MDYRPLSLESFPEKLRRNVDPASPPPMRLMAARGLLPAAPGEMLMVLYQLTFDVDAAVGNQAKKTVADSPQSLMLTAAAADVPGVVLDFLVTHRPKDTKIIEAVLTNRAALDGTYERLAKTVGERLTEIIAVNEVRLLRTPKIIENLYMNPAARMSTVDRLIDLGARNGVRFENPALQGLIDDPGYNTTEAAANAIAREFDEEGDDAFKSLLNAATAEEGEPPEESDEDVEKADLDGADEAEEEPEKKTTNLAAAILNMSISEKMRMAMLGSSSEREFLIKDNNRLVHMAAVTSPKVRLKDVQAWSGNRMMPDGVLTYIAGHRRYRRVYKIVVNLVNNPKTPVKESMRLFPQLVAKDLAALLKNRNIPHQVRRAAKAMSDERYRKSRGGK